MKKVGAGKKLLAPHPTLCYKQHVNNNANGVNKMNKEHGSPWDRGTADSHYNRRYNPHYYQGTTRISKEDMNPEQVAEYEAGWEHNESIGDYKDYR